MKFARLIIGRLALILIACMISAPAYAAVVEGVVFNEEGPLTDSSVNAYSRLGEVGSAPPQYVSSPGERPGSFRMKLPPGQYFFTAVGNKEGKSYFSFHGANPVTIEEERLWLPFAAVAANPASKSGATPDTISGVVTYHGQPVQDAQVSIYPSADEQFKGLGLLSCTTPANGSFRFSAAAGSYIVVARKRINSFGLMPLKKGDLFCYYPGNPLQITPGESVRIEIPCYPRDDLQGFLSQTATDNRGRNSHSSIRARSKKTETITRSIRGKVTDLNGNGVSGILVQAYRKSGQGVFQMHYLRLMPDRQALTDSTGSYQIDLSTEDDFFLLAREHSGQAPGKGEWYGLYEGVVDHSVSPVTLSLDANIIVSRLMSSEDASINLPKASRSLNGQLKLNDTVIDHDTTWSGRVKIAGRVVVGRGVTLNIRPGTVVSFVRRDLNADGIGDAELRILGRLIAKGTVRKPVCFRSAARNPKPGDWAYILVYAASGIAILDHCTIEHAFTGLQVHFSQAVVTNSIFRKNTEGIRFGRGELTIEHNHISNNHFGIRHTRLEGAVLIRYNFITNNDIGIFHVPSNQNVINFGDTYESRDTVAPVQPVVKFNHLGSNRRYAYALGDRQGYDIDVSDNWWGIVSESKIEELIYDRRRDPSLGRVRFKPALSSPPKWQSAKRKESQ